MDYVPFCVIEKPYSIWAPDIRADNDNFLKHLDARFYERMVQTIVTASNENRDKDQPDEELQTGQDRRDISTLARMLWHHGMETLVMLLGAYIQAPGAVHGYFVKSKTEDAVAIAGYLLREERPRYHRLNDVPFTLSALLLGVYQRAGCDAGDANLARFEEALRSMLSDYVRESHRAEYNSIKHGLRASHGNFSITIASDRSPKISSQAEEMQVIGSSRDASWTPAKTDGVSVSMVIH